jgi:16S rRNA processing protein RimM
VGEHAEQQEARLIRIGKVVRAVGLRGLVGVAGTDGALADLKRVVLRCTGADGLDPRQVVEARPQGRLWAVQLEGVAGREAAEALVGCEVLAVREDLREPGEGLYYWTDLEGLTVVTVAGEMVGKVTDVYATGGVDVLVVTGERGEVLIPLAPYVTVDQAAGRVVVDPPEGLLDVEDMGREEKGGPERGA